MAQSEGSAESTDKLVVLWTSDDLKNMDFVVKGMGSPLTGYLKSGAKVLTF